MYNKCAFFLKKVPILFDLPMPMLHYKFTYLSSKTQDLYDYRFVQYEVGFMACSWNPLLQQPLKLSQYSD
jgi:hypothetical protein